MASLWQKTLFYLGLVDEDQDGNQDAGAPVSGQGEVRTLEQPPSNAGGSVSSVGVRPPGTVAGRRVEPSGGQRIRMSPEPTHAEAGVYVQRGGSGFEATRYVGYGRSDAETEIIIARTFSDAQTLADSIRNARSVVLDLRSTEPEMVRRLVDFASGLTYALDGKMAKISRGVILVSPPGVSISAGEHERLTALGLYASTES